MTDAETLFDAICDELGNVLVGNEDIIEGLTIALVTRGHILLEGVPGVAKTTIALGFARATGLDHNRIQMTPDVLPADITGTHVYREDTGEFTPHRGPVFANVVLADEINRATPKTQSALLETMQEQQVTIEGETLPLPDPFFLIATQNPIEMEGVFDLPEAQRDRFQQKLTVSLPDHESEREILDRFDSDPYLGYDAVEQVVSRSDVLAVRERVVNVYVDEKVKEYILSLVEATRQSTDIEHGASPRAALALLNVCKARALLHGREYVTPDDAKQLASRVLAHRLVLSTDAGLRRESSEDIMTRIIDTVDVPTLKR